MLLQTQTKFHHNLVFFFFFFSTVYSYALSYGVSRWKGNIDAHITKQKNNITE